MIGTTCFCFIGYFVLINFCGQQFSALLVFYIFVFCFCYRMKGKVPHSRLIVDDSGTIWYKWLQLDFFRFISNS